MIRGTTPTLEFELPFSSDEISICSIALSQRDEVVVEKKLEDCQTDGNMLRCTLTEKETLLLDCDYGVVEIQVRLKCGNRALASDIIQMSVGRILKDGCLE